MYFEDTRFRKRVLPPRVSLEYRIKQASVCDTFDSSYAAASTGVLPFFHRQYRTPERRCSCDADGSQTETWWERVGIEPRRAHFVIKEQSHVSLDPPANP